MEKEQINKIVEGSICKLCNGTGWIKGKDGYITCKCVELKKIKSLWESFGVNPEETKTLDDYTTYNDETLNAKKKAIEYVEIFQRINNTTECSFALFGQPGGGKTHIILAIGRELIEKHIQVVYMPYLEAIRELKASTMDDEYYRKLSNRYKKAEVLIIDDLFKDKVKQHKLLGQLTEADMKHIYPIINFRYFNRLPMLISTECTPQMLTQLDEALAGRIIECVSNFGVIFTKESNYRLRKFMSLNKC